MGTTNNVLKEVKKTTGIYKITWKENGKVRIGHAGNIKKRWSQYLAELRGNNFCNINMQEDFNKYGEDKFEIELITECAKYKCKELENYYMDLYKAIDNGYNTYKNDLTKKKKIRRGKESVKFKKDRSTVTSGENNGHNTKLTKEMVREIKIYQYEKTYRDKELAKMYNCSLALINNIRRGERWASISIEDYIEQKEKEDIAFGEVTSSCCNAAKNTLASVQAKQISDI